MFGCLAVEGWRASNLLPQGWMFKIHGPAVINFFNKDGIFIKSFQKMWDHLQTRSQLTKATIDNLSNLESRVIDLFSSPFRTSDIDVVENVGQRTKPDIIQSVLGPDQSVNKGKSPSKQSHTKEIEDIPKRSPLPPGWIVNENRLISPLGVVYSSAKSAFIALRKQKGQEKVVQAILKLPCASDWSTRNLPSGWMIRVTRSEGSCGAKYNIIGPDGSFFESKSRASAHLVTLGGSQENKNLLQNFSGCTSLQKTIGVTKIHQFKEVSRSEESEKKEAPLTATQQNKICIPETRLYNEASRPEGSEKEGASLRMLQEVLGSGGSEKEAAPLREFLLTKGWRTLGLPHGWMGLPNHWMGPNSGYRWVFLLCFFCLTLSEYSEFIKYDPPSLFSS